MRTLLVLFSVLLSGIASAQSATEAIMALKKLSAKIEVGISYREYTSELGNVNSAVKEFEGSDEAKRRPGVKAAISRVMGHYSFAQAVWLTKISGYAKNYLSTKDSISANIISQYPDVQKSVSEGGALSEGFGLYIEEVVSIIWNTAGNDLARASESFAATKPDRQINTPGEKTLLQQSQPRESKSKATNPQSNGEFVEPRDLDFRYVQHMLFNPPQKTQKTNGFIKGKYTDSAAMAFLYGKYSEANNNAIWENVQPPNNLNVGVPFPGSVGVVSVVLSQAYVVDKNEKRILVTQTAPQDEEFKCHTCRPFLSIALFAKEGNDWRVESHIPNFVYSGAWGKAGKLQWVQVAANRWALLLQEYDMHQGYLSGHVTLFWEETGAFYEKFSYADGMQDGELTFDLTFLKSRTGSYFDMQIDRLSSAYSETKDEKQTHIFKYADNRYVERFATKTFVKRADTRQKQAADTLEPQRSQQNALEKQDKHVAPAFAPPPSSRIATPAEIEQAKQMSSELSARGINISPAQALGLIWTERDLCGNRKDCR